MDSKQKANHAVVTFLVLLIVSGNFWCIATTMQLFWLKKKNKEFWLQIKLFFDSVGGRLINEAVKEDQIISENDLIMELDSADTNSSIEKLKAQIAQLDAQINSTSGSMQLKFFQANNDEHQSFRQIDSKRVLVDSAKATLTNAEIDYKRKLNLFNEDAIAQSQLDDAVMTLNVAKASVKTQQQALEKLLAGANDSNRTD